MKKLIILFLLLPLFAVSQISFPNNSKQQGKKLFVGDVKMAKSFQVGMNGLQIDSIKLVNGKYVIYKAGVAYDPSFNSSYTLGSLVPLKADSTKSSSGNYVTYKQLNKVSVKRVFGGGGNCAFDTLAFTTSTVYGSFYNGGSQTLVVDSLNIILGHGLGLDTLGVQVQWHKTFLSGSATKLNTTTMPIGTWISRTTGIVITSFTNIQIPPGVRVWCTTPYVPADALKRKPVYMEVSLVGHYK